MRPAVATVFPYFSARFEGRVSYMYLDVLGLVTCGVGNLIDPISQALPLPWLAKADGHSASRALIVAEWTRVKSLQSLRIQGGGAFASSARLVLADSAIDALVRGKLRSNDFSLANHVSGYSGFPADAQLALLSMAWAEGPVFMVHYPKMMAYLGGGDFEGAALECTISEAGNPGVVPRNVANRICFHNAARVIAEGRDPDILCWPMVLPPPDPSPLVA